MELCIHAQDKGDSTGRLEYYCSRHAWRMDLDVMDKCRDCPEYSGRDVVN